jgi:hypothetical protein
VKRADAISIARNYFKEWDVPWGDIVDSKRRLAWWPPLSGVYFWFLLETGHGPAEVLIDAADRQVSFMEFYPTDADHRMVPLWAAYPTYSSVTIHWRMGNGEDYRYGWNGWYSRLSHEQRAEYQRRFPAPEDDRGWEGFYDDG